MYNKLFEGLDTKEQNAVKFAFELVDKMYNAALVKLKANGSTGYPVYYLYVNCRGQGTVVRILKQDRKCKLMPFGNPKIVWTFVNDTKAKMPTRKEATVEYVGNCLQNMSTGQFILDFVNKNNKNEKKKNKMELTHEEIKFVIDGMLNKTIEDYQISSLLMAIVLNGMNLEETYYLTYEMFVHSSASHTPIADPMSIEYLLHNYDIPVLKKLP